MHAMIRRRPDLATVMVAFGLVLRVWRWAQGRSFWLDEEMLAMNIRHHGLSGLTGQLDDDQAAPLGWLWVEKLIAMAFGEGERALRLQPMLYGVGALLLAWWIGRRWLHPAGSAMLVALFACSPTLLTFSDQLKQYSADVFWVLLLIALAARVVEEPADRARRWQFWLLAAAGSWMSMGALLAIPALALVIGGQALLRREWRTVAGHLLPGVVLVTSFAVHYVLSLRFTVQNPYLADFWSGIGYPPDGAGPKGMAKWLVAAWGRLSENPMDLWQLNTDVPWYMGAATVLFWLMTLAGVIVAMRRRVEYGLLLLGVLVSGPLFAVLHLVPLAVRLALWLVPAAYLAVAIAFQAAAQAFPAVWRRARESWIRPIAVAALGYALLLPLVVIVLASRSVHSVAAEPELDDRAAVAWMREQHRPGDLVLLVTSATRALQWYDPQGSLRPFTMVISVPAGSANCDPAAIGHAVEGYRRVIAYSGVRYFPYLDAHEVLRKRVSELGTIVQVRHFGTQGVVYVVDLSPAPATAAPGACLAM
jgi:hypothetical protein